MWEAPLRRGLRVHRELRICMCAWGARQASRQCGWPTFGALHATAPVAAAGQPATGPVTRRVTQPIVRGTHGARVALSLWRVPTGQHTVLVFSAEGPGGSGGGWSGCLHGLVRTRDA